MMTEKTDRELLQSYTIGQSEAFDELARRYTPMVYSAAMRQVRSHHTAEDVVQAVFLLLSRKASRLAAGASLPGWLILTTRNVCGNALRAQRRRDRYEHMASQQEQIPAPDWQTISGELDGAMARLGRDEREVLALRYFRGLSLQEVGQSIGTTEEAARKRVMRALDRLRGVLATSGVTCSAVALDQLLLQHAIVGQIPEHLTAVAAAAAGKGASAGAVTLAKATGTALMLAKLKLATITIAAAAAATGGVYVAVQATASPTSNPAAVQAQAAPTLATTQALSESPRQAIAAFLRALLVGDPEIMRQYLLTSTPEQQEAAEAMIRLVSGSMELQQSVVATFGKDARLTNVNFPDDIPPMPVDRWREQIDGDSATVTLTPDMHPNTMSLRRVDGTWRVDVTQIPSGIPGPKGEKPTQAMNRLADAMEQTTLLVRSGRFKTTKEVDAHMGGLIEGKKQK